MTTSVLSTSNLPDPDDTSTDSVWARAIVVGVSMRSGSPAALRWGLEEARHRGVPMVALTAFRPSATSSTIKPTPSRGVDSSDIIGRAKLGDLRQVVRRALGPNAEKMEDVELAAVRGSRSEVLIRVSQQACLLVVDASSVNPEPIFASSLLRNAQCPVVAMPRPVRKVHEKLDSVVSSVTVEGKPASDQSES